MGITILGSTGSIGSQTLEVIKELGYEVDGLAANKNIEKLEEQIKEFKPKIVAVYDIKKAQELRKKVNVKVYSGLAGLIEVTWNADVLVNALVGSIGLMPTIKAIEKHVRKILMSNKEAIVMAGNLLMKKAKKKKVLIYPVDSEHSAIWQCLKGENKRNVERIILTCSGGPFYNFSLEELENVTVEQALSHPVWKMGNKITIDSATLMNKGLEVIEAKHLFDMELDKIEVVIHPESTIHSMVEYADGSVIAQLGLPDMKIPIQYALTYPNRAPKRIPKKLNFDQLKLNFYKPTDKFPCLRLAYEACKISGTMPTVLNAANEIAVNKFLDGEIKFLGIPKFIEKVMEEHKVVKYPNFDVILAVDEEIKKKYK